ncbi:FecR family protein [Algivirga pacifica]|uniref:FecR family protein n=1 Tax=Algivirga pacifica TaxID=1162670 RepID=A0ABP9DJR7_9BACT
MDKKEQINKWLDDNMSSEERSTFEQSEAFERLQKLSYYYLQQKKQPYAVQEEWEKIQNNLPQKNRTISFFPSYRLWQVAAVIALLLVGGVYFMNQLPTTHYAHPGDSLALTLPDASSVRLNAGSQLSYKESEWDKQRDVQLEGEAFFKVKKGSSFRVHTSLGSVEVLGTEFNVKERDNWFEVSCFEGLVAVQHNGKNIELPAGKTFSVNKGITKLGSVKKFGEPLWTKGESYFNNTPLQDVLKEIERQYDLSIKAQSIDSSVHFSGSFPHNNLEATLKSVTLPLGISYKIIDRNTVVLK